VAVNFRSVAHLSEQVREWSRTLPGDIDLIVGVPRSGLLVANLLAVHLNLPLTDVAGLVDGRVFEVGRSKPPASLREEGREGLVEVRHALVVDDSVGSGKTMRAVRERVAHLEPRIRLSFGAVYVAPGHRDVVDHHVEELAYPRIFEWNVLDNHLLRRSCLDLDGVLCHDPSFDENDDGPRYRAFIENARPLLLPRAPVRYIVTSRLEEWREETEAWLDRHGVRFEELVMLDSSSAAHRRELRLHAPHKAEFYRRSDAVLFIESSVRQSIEIASLAKKPVLCMDVMRMVRPGDLAVASDRPWTAPDPKRRRVRRIRRIGRSVVPRTVRIRLGRMRQT
jgi:orotate phosphoribosyltransferase